MNVKSKIFKIMLIYIAIICMLTGCSNKTVSPLDPNSPVVVTLWHSYNSYAKSIFDELVLEFNDTVGYELGIIIETYNYGSSSELEDAIYDSANNIIGSSSIPNILTTYPSNAYRVDKLTPLVELNKYFTEKELSEYYGSFLDENKWDDNETVKMIPAAKSTEVLYLNKTDWESFSNDTGCTLEQLETWEGILSVSEKYYEWSDGKPMFGFNPYNNFMSLSSAQLGKSPYLTEKNGENKFVFEKDIARKIWDFCYIPHMMGWYESNSYCSDGIKSGELIAYVGSSAGSAFFPTEVTLDVDNVYPIDCIVLPYPVFSGGELYMQQRGANMCIIQSNNTHDYAAAEFLKWFTQTKQNTLFTISTGYIPVKNESLSSEDEVMQIISSMDNSKNVSKCMTMIMDNINKRKFYSEKIYNGSYEVGQVFDNLIFKKIEEDLKKLDFRIQNNEKKDEVIAELINDTAFEIWYNALIEEITSKLN